MTQVLQHDYGKSKVTLVQIRSAIKAVKKERGKVAACGHKAKNTTVRKLSSTRCKKTNK
jgi:hypothetical protein